MPYLVDGSYKNQESTVTLKYIAQKAPNAGLYPASKASEIDELLKFNGEVFRPTVLAPVMVKFGKSQASWEDALATMWTAYDKLNVYCKKARANNTYLVGTDKVTIADIQLWSEALDAYLVN